MTKPFVTRGVITALDLRVGNVVAAETAVDDRGGRTLLSVDFGELGVLQAAFRLPKDLAEGLVGQLVVAVVNLTPRQARAVRRDFVLLVADDDHRGVVAVTTSEDTAPGTAVRDLLSPATASAPRIEPKAEAP